MPKKSAKWAKIDTTAEEQVLDERSSEQAQKQVSDANLFQVDTVGNYNSIRNRKRRAEALAESNPKRYRVYDSDDEVDEEAARKAQQKLKLSLRKESHFRESTRRPRIAAWPKQAELTVLQPVDTTNRKGEVVEDLWSVDPTLMSSAIGGSIIAPKPLASTVIRAESRGYVAEQRQGLANSTLLHRPERATPDSKEIALNLPHPGQSYNPDSSAHSELMNFVRLISLSSHPVSSGFSGD